jgi:hypothetical protein
MNLMSQGIISLSLSSIIEISFCMLESSNLQVHHRGTKWELLLIKKWPRILVLELCLSYPTLNK